MEITIRRGHLMLLAGILGATAVNAQTQIDLRSQSRNVDFSGAQSVRPFRTGTVLPSTCNPGEMFFKTNASSGSNTYGCVALNIWAVQGGGGSGSAASVPDFQAELNTTSNTLRLSCTGDCNIRNGDVVTRFPNLQATFIPTTGNYTAFIYLDGQVLRYGYSSGAMNTCTASCLSGISQFPSNVVQLYTVSVSGGVFQTGSLVAWKSFYSTPKRVLQGSNIVIAETADSVIWSGVSTLRSQPVGSKPACSASTRGTFWHTNGSTGVKDTVEICAKDALDVYAWRIIL